jgi:hypothetical protein
MSALAMQAIAPDMVGPVKVLPERFFIFFSLLFCGGCSFSR